MHFRLAGGSSSSSEELSIVKSITSTFFLFTSLATVTEHGLLTTLEPEEENKNHCSPKAGDVSSFYLQENQELRSCIIDHLSGHYKECYAPVPAV